MQAKDEKRDLRYCRYYHGERQCPYMDAFKGRAWIAEELASERASDSAKDFLSFVAAHISKWEPYGYEPDVARYIAFSDCCSLEERLEIARAYAIGDALLLQKPQGETVFESFFIGQGFASSIVNKGVLLYPDGSVYIENVDRRDFERANPVYFYVGKYQETADAVKQLIDENWERISALPSKIDDAVCDGGFSYYKFLSKNFDGVIYGGTEESKAVKDFHNQVLNIFYRKNSPSVDWLETATIK